MRKTIDRIEIIAIVDAHVTISQLALVVGLSGVIFSPVVRSLNEDPAGQSLAFNLAVGLLLYLLAPLGYGVTAERLRRARLESPGFVAFQRFDGTVATALFIGQVVLSAFGGVSLVFTVVQVSGGHRVTVIAAAVTLIILGALIHIFGMRSVSHAYERESGPTPLLSALPGSLLSVLFFFWRAAGLSVVWTGMGSMMLFSMLEDSPGAVPLLYASALGIIIFALFYFPWRVPCRLLDKISDPALSRPGAEISSFLMLYLMVLVPMLLSMLLGGE